MIKPNVHYPPDQNFCTQGRFIVNGEKTSSTCVTEEPGPQSFGHECQEICKFIHNFFFGIDIKNISIFNDIDEREFELFFLNLPCL